MDSVDWAGFDKQINVLDACCMTNQNGKVVIQPGGHSVAARALLGGALGLLVGALFAIPIAGLAAGSAVGGRRGKRGAQHFDDAFVESIRSMVAKGGSAVVVLYEDGASAEPTGADLAGLGGTVHSATISADELARIQSMLDEQGTDRS